jgi:hypothetical protein
VVSRDETQLLSGLRLVCGDPVKPLLTKAVNSVEFLSHVSRPDANACGSGMLDVGWRESKRMSHMNSTQGQSAVQVLPHCSMEIQVHRGQIAGEGVSYSYF